jgi:hypothetical protein
MNKLAKGALWSVLTVLMFLILKYFIYDETLLAVFLGCAAFIFSLVIDRFWLGKDIK